MHADVRGKSFQRQFINQLLIRINFEIEINCHFLQRFDEYHEWPHSPSSCPSKISDQKPEAKRFKISGLRKEKELIFKMRTALGYAQKRNFILTLR